MRRSIPTYAEALEAAKSIGHKISKAGIARLFRTSMRTVTNAFALAEAAGKPFRPILKKRRVKRHVLYYTAEAIQLGVEFGYISTDDIHKDRKSRIELKKRKKYVKRKNNESSPIL